MIGRRDVTLRVPGGEIHGDLTAPPGSRGVVVFAHGSGSDRTSPRNRAVARALEEAGFATLLLDLLTLGEASIDARTRQYRFDIPRLADRLTTAVDAASAWPEVADQPVGLFGASTGGAAALITAAARPDRVAAVVLRGARSDLAGAAARGVRAPTLFLVGALDPEIRRMNEATRREMAARTELVQVAGASHLFEEPGALEEVARRAREWFSAFLVSPAK